MVKIILSVGFEFPGGDVENIPYNENRSLLDADIVIFKPMIPNESSFIMDTFRKRPKLGEGDAFQAEKEAKHWRTELKAVLDAGKTIIVYLSKYEEFSVDNDINNFNNYSCLPAEFSQVVNAIGTEIKVATDLKYFAPYWQEFAKYSSYQLYIDGTFDNVILTTKTGDRTIGAIIKISKGTMILIPPLQYNDDEFFDFDEEDEEVWTEKAITFGRSLISIIVEMDKAIHSNNEATPLPEWAKGNEYRLKEEVKLKAKIKLQ